MIRLSRLGFKVLAAGELAHRLPHVPKAAVSYLGRGPVQAGGPADYTRLVQHVGSWRDDAVTQYQPNLPPPLVMILSIEQLDI